MSLLTTTLTGGMPGWSRIAMWLRNLALSLFRHPVRTLRVLQPFGWARENVVLLCMQALEGNLEMSWRRPWYRPWRKCLVSRGKKVPTYIPQANAFAETFARITGGTAMSMLPEILFDVPGTAHCLGGCVMADSPERGVVDHQHRVFGYRNMYVSDGSVVGANLGVNPSLTITALAERAMDFIPEAGITHWDDFAGQSKQCKKGSISSSLN
jgi:cholesterol oxidase